jgi:hypothetical protein
MDAYWEAFKVIVLYTIFAGHIYLAPVLGVLLYALYAAGLSLYASLSRKPLTDKLGCLPFLILGFALDSDSQFDRVPVSLAVRRLRPAASFPITMF